MTKGQAIEEVNKAFEPAFANYIITALTEGATVSDKTLEQQPCDDCVSREQAIKTIGTDIQLNLEGRSGLLKYSDEIKDILKALLDNQEKKLKALPPVTPTHGTCEDCKHWDKDNEYCKHLSTENGWSEDEYYQVCTDKDFYCREFERRGDSDGSN